jgi:hypothetical protein
LKRPPREYGRRPTIGLILERKTTFREPLIF